MRALPGDKVTVRASQTLEQLRPIVPSSRASLLADDNPGPTATANIEVTYDGFSQAAQDAFQAAVDVWETQIVSSRVIHVNARWEPLGSGILGSAGPNVFYVLDDGRAYPGALAEALLLV